MENPPLPLIAIISAHYLFNSCIRLSRPSPPSSAYQIRDKGFTYQVFTPSIPIEFLHRYSSNTLAPYVSTVNCDNSIDNEYKLVAIQIIAFYYYKLLVSFLFVREIIIIIAPILVIIMTIFKKPNIIIRKCVA